MLGHWVATKEKQDTSQTMSFPLSAAEIALLLGTAGDVWLPALIRCEEEWSVQKRKQLSRSWDGFL